MSGLVDQVRGFVGERAPALVQRGEAGPAVATAVLAASVLQAYDASAFEQVATPALAAVLNRDAEAAAGILPEVVDLRRQNAGNDDPDVPAAIMDQVLLTLQVAVSSTMGTSAADDLVHAAVAAVSLAERLGEVEALPDEQLPAFADLIADPGYLTAPVPITWREAARQVRAMRLVDEHPDPWSAILPEADALGTQLRVLAETLRGLRGPVSQAYPTMQDFDFSSGRATALRTAPPELVADATALRQQVEIWIEKVAAFKGYRRIGAIPTVPASLVASRELVVAVPPGGSSRPDGLFDSLVEQAAAGPVPVALRFVEVR